MTQVSPYFTQRRPSVSINQRLMSDMMRYEIGRKLKNRDEVDLDTADEDGAWDGFNLIPLPNNGIQGVFQETPFKVLRSRNREVPPPGESPNRKNFYNQKTLGRQLFLLDPTLQPDIQTYPNVIILYDLSPDLRTASLRLALPIETNGPQGFVTCLFNVSIEVPSLEESAVEEVIAPEPVVEFREDRETDAVPDSPRSLAGKPLAGFRATPSRRIPVLYSMVMYIIRVKNPLLHRQSTLRKRRVGENRGSRPDF